MGTHSCSENSYLRELVGVALERLQGCVLSHGQFANRIGLDEDRSVLVEYPYSLMDARSGARRGARITWGIPQLLLRLNLKNLDFVK